MIKVCVMYPSVEGSRFDMRYCLEKHMPIWSFQNISKLSSLSPK